MFRKNGESKSQMGIINKFALYAEILNTLQ